MKVLLVLTVACYAAAEAQVLYSGYPYALGAPLTYTYTPQVTKLVPKEVEVPIKTIQYGIKDTGCTNVFGFNVPCLAEGEARRKRQAEEEEVAVEEEAAAEEEAPEAAVAVSPYLLPGNVLSYGLPLAGYPYGGYGYPYGYSGLPLTYPYAQVKVAEPEVTEVEVPHLVYKPEIEQVDLQPLCHNGLGFPVPCA